MSSLLSPVCVSYRSVVSVPGLAGCVSPPWPVKPPTIREFAVVVVMSTVASVPLVAVFPAVAPIGEIWFTPV